MGLRWSISALGLALICARDVTSSEVMRSIYAHIVAAKVASTADTQTTPIRMIAAHVLFVMAPVWNRHRGTIEQH